MKTNWDRRRFLEFMGRSAALGAAASAGLPALSALTGGLKSARADRAAAPLNGALPFASLKPSIQDDVILADGFKYDVLLSWGDKINRKGELFGFNNDFTVFFPLDKKGDDGLLWVNHEYVNSLFISGLDAEAEKNKTREQVMKEQESLGGSIVRIKKNSKTGKWALVANDKRNRRVSGRTPIPFVSERPIFGAKEAIGTLGNCAGGITAWGTVLTCEENCVDVYGDVVFKDGKRTVTYEDAYYYFQNHFPYPPEHYGWVVEVDPFTGKARKHTSMGRFGHECATFALSKDGYPVVYTGDDENDEFIYKFISSSKTDLNRGTLYVADTKAGRWLPLDMAKDERLKKAFTDQTELLIRTREAARIVGASPQDRPEDFEIDPATGAILVALTNNKKKGNFHGSILRIAEKDGDHGALEFASSTFLAGGDDAGFSCPDNMAFDPKGNLWFTSDIAGDKVGKEMYVPFGNNGLYYVPFTGPDSGKVFRVAIGPMDAELTGPRFSPDGRTLFVSVQHPGETTKTLASPTSHWPEGKGKMPKPSVITITGPALDKLMA